MIAISQAFAASYAQARARFVGAAATAGLALQPQVHPLRGPDGETLALDVVRDGPPDARRLLIVSSGCHGVEGLCGSGVQVFALHDAQWRAKARAQGVAVLYLHALNPHGFAHWRRVTEENVDLNRNFVDFSQSLPANPAYSALHPVLLPPEWPPTDANTQALMGLLQTQGLKALQAAITQGQYAHPDGLYFGGASPTWSHRTLRDVLRREGAQAQRIAWVDLHSGLGPAGYGERIHDGREVDEHGRDSGALARARRWWSGGAATPVTSTQDGSSSSAPVTGLMCHSAYDECPHAQLTALTLEFGTQPAPAVLQALRADHWLHLHPQASPTLAALIHAQMREAFYTDTDAWRGQVISQARQVLFQAVDGLAE
ncbi:M14 family metallopeptidase [Diaphorobacter sp.]|uniref:M14 family metallopeptidase n=1 Tax=Diaphorobacter sp. TaxID=1934310 RepID=UPI003D1222B7